MANNNTNSSVQHLIPIFKGEKYHLWNLKMKAMFKSRELWDLVENGYDEPNSAPTQPSQQSTIMGESQEKHKGFVPHPISTR